MQDIADHPTGVEMIRRARLGDPAAWDALVGDHREPVFRLAYLMIGDEDDAEDIAQETFIRAQRALGTFDPDRPLRPWLLKITANLARNWRRSYGRYGAFLRRLFLSDPQVSEPAAEIGSARQLESRQVWRAVRRLKRSDQQVLYLRYFLDMSLEETAAAMDVPTGTVKSRGSRALKRLKTIIEEEFPELKDWSDDS